MMSHAKNKSNSSDQPRSRPSTLCHHILHQRKLGLDGAIACASPGTKLKGQRLIRNIVCYQLSGARLLRDGIGTRVHACNQGASQPPAKPSAPVGLLSFQGFAGRSFPPSSDVNANISEQPPLSTIGAISMGKRELHA